MKLFKFKKLNNTQIRPLHVIPTRHLHIKYCIIISLILLTTILNNRLYDVVYSPKQCIAAITLEAKPEVEDRLSKKISRIYNLSYKDSKEIVDQAVVYSNPVFPTVYDILAIIAIESRFNVYAKSETSSAKGLMQVLYKNTSFDISQNISDGVNLLLHYKEKLKSEDA